MNNLSKGLASHLQGMSDAQARATLEMEGRRLKYIALKMWRKYISSYQPNVYIRTRDSQRGIKLGEVKRIDENHFGIELTYENDLMYHDSWFDKERGTKGNWDKGHAVMLISDGWHARKLESRFGRIHRFTYFEGTGYLYQVYKEYMRGAPLGVTLDVQWSGNYTKR